MPSNHPVNADARGAAVPCKVRWARAGYWERYGSNLRGKFMIDMPELPPQYAQVVVAQASLGQKGDAKTDRTIGVCHLIENPPIPAGSAVNAISPVTTVWEYLKKLERSRQSS